VLESRFGYTSNDLESGLVVVARLNNTFLWRTVLRTIKQYIVTRLLYCIRIEVWLYQ